MKAIFLPGASLMEITQIDDGVLVRCPGCGRAELYHGKGARTFAHDERCAVYARIQEATRRAERGVNHG